MSVLLKDGILSALIAGLEDGSWVQTCFNVQVWLANTGNAWLADKGNAWELIARRHLRAGLRLSDRLIEEFNTYSLKTPVGTNVHPWESYAA